MIYVGTDIEEVSRLKRLLESRESLLKRIFTSHEWEYAQTKQAAQTLAGIWCAKEAVLKAFTPVMDVSLFEIEITKNAKGFPQAIIHSTKISQLKYELSLSISHTKDLATATAILKLEG